MHAGLLTNVLLPLALAVIMFGLGLGLAAADFRRVARYPRAVLVGLALQTLLLPWVAFALARGFGLAPELAVGLMLLAASPGGATANIYSHLARGDVALNITLTAINSLLCLLTLPVILDLSMDHFLGAGRYVPPPTMKVVEVALIIVLPVLAGMLVRARAPAFAARAERPMRLLSILVLVVLVTAAVAREWRTLADSLGAVGLACVLFNLASLGVGYAAPRLLRLPRRQATAIAMEIGIHNGTLAIFIALNVLGNAVMSIPAAVYSLVMFATAAAFATWVARGNAATAAAIPGQTR